MNKDCYPFRCIQEDVAFYFVSEGIHGQIEKIVLISAIHDEKDNDFSPLYNLAFGDLVHFDGEWVLDDSVRSGNGDMPKILATVAKIAIHFLRKHPDRTLSFRGYMDQKSASRGKNHRNILYQRVIDSNWTALSEFNFWGVKVGNTEPYTVGRPYDQILTKHK